MIRSERLTKQHRLLTAASFQSILKDPGLRKSRGQLQLVAARNTIAHARLGLIVPKRVVPHAHDRNRVKRVIREAFRRRAGALPALDLIFRVRQPTAEPGLQECLGWLLDWVEEQQC